MAEKSKSSKEKPLKDIIEDLNNQMLKAKNKLAKVREAECYTLFLRDTSIEAGLVNAVFDDLSKNYSECKKLDVIVDSPGGNINAAYNLAQLLRRFGKDQLTFIIPRWAKSAATLLVCAGDKILMTPVAELGPIDPQIKEYNPLDQRIEEFSPLHIESTLELIRQEFKNGNKQLAEGLLGRLQFPLTLGSFKKSLDIGQEYVEKLLSTRMLKKGSKSAETASKIAKKLTSGYSDHGYCINYQEAKELGLNVEELSNDKVFEIVWEIYSLYNQQDKHIREQKQKEYEDKLGKLPRDIVEEVLRKNDDHPKKTDISPDGGTKL